MDEAADTVRLIFSLYLSGVGLRPISQLLNQQQRKTPAQLQAELYGKHNPDIHTDKDGQHIYLWNYTGVKRILSDENYAGTLRNHKAEMHKGKVTLFIPKEEQFRHEDFLPAIVSKKEWLTAQTELVSRNGKRVPRENNIAAHRYAGLLKRGDCGALFVPIIRWWNGKQRVEYICRNYQLYGKSFCESHRIHENAERYTALIIRLTADHEQARLELNNLKTLDAKLRRKLRDLAKRIAALDKVLKNTPIDEADLRRLTDYIEVRQNGKTLEIQVKLKDTL
ncbi:recombinase [Peptococcaceae bacterium CEB3]|nr:recombinase [Peptococcaceae bacterium CEB3]